MRDDHSGADDKHLKGAGSTLELFEGFRRRGSVKEKRERYANTFCCVKSVRHVRDKHHYYNGDAVVGESNSIIHCQVGDSAFL